MGTFSGTPCVVVVTASLYGPWSNYQSTEEEQISDEKMDRDCWRQDGSLESYSGRVSNVALAFFSVKISRKWKLYGESGEVWPVYAFSWYFPCHFRLAPSIIHQFTGLWLVTWPEYWPLIGHVTWILASDWSILSSSSCSIYLDWLCQLLVLLTRRVQISVSRNRKLFLHWGI